MIADHKKIKSNKTELLIALGDRSASNNKLYDAADYYLRAEMLMPQRMDLLLKLSKIILILLQN